MIFFILLLLIIIVSSAEMAKPNEFFGDYISKDKSNTIKGLFVFLVFLRHVSQYISLDTAYDSAFTAVDKHFGQMIVAMFLFYSGYGIMEQIKHKGFSYVKSIPTKRFPSVYLNFVLAVLLFVILNLILGKGRSLKTTLLAFTGWTAVGNSNWYMLVTFILYILTFIAFLAVKKMKKERLYVISIIAMTLLTVGYIVIMKKIGKESRYYNTVILYPLGMWYSYLKAPIEKLLMKNDVIFYIFAALMTGMYLASHKYRGAWGMWSYAVWAAVFTASCVMFTMKFSINSTFLNWLGGHVFSIYILQRLPMIVFKNIGFASHHKYMFVIASFAVTVAISLAFDYFTGKLNTKLFGKKKEKALTQ